MLHKYLNVFFSFVCELLKMAVCAITGIIFTLNKYSVIYTTHI
jgi:hypothetical protein